MDETGWRVHAELHWLWTAVTQTTTVYAILPGRGFDEAAWHFAAGGAVLIVRRQRRARRGTVRP